MPRILVSKLVLADRKAGSSQTARHFSRQAVSAALTRKYDPSLRRLKPEAIEKEAAGKPSGETPSGETAPK